MLTTVPWNADDEPLLRMSTRSADKPSPLLISARDESAGQDESRAMLLLSSIAKRGYADSEDAVMLDSRDSRGPRVYTIAGNLAVSVNATDNAEGVEIGIITDGDGTTVLRFDNVDAFYNLSLYDRLTEKAVPLSEGMEYVVEGSASGRLFLTAGIKELEILSVYTDCGCTATRYSTEPMAPGATSTIAVSFNPVGRPSGFFSKIIRVKTNASPKPLRLYIKGKIKTN